MSVPVLWWALLYGWGAWIMSLEATDYLRRRDKLDAHGRAAVRVSAVTWPAVYTIAIVAWIGKKVS